MEYGKDWQKLREIIAEKTGIELDSDDVLHHVNNLKLQRKVKLIASPGGVEPLCIKRLKENKFKFMSSDDHKRLENKQKTKILKEHEILNKILRRQNT